MTEEKREWGAWFVKSADEPYVWNETSGGDRQKLAALALGNQAFGFSRYDVTLLRHAAKYAKPAHPELSGLADRIEGLLAVSE